MALLIPASAAAHEPLDGSDWPTVDELRRDLQGIGYEFVYDDTSRLAESTFRPELPGIWRLSEPVVVEPDMPDDVEFESFGLMIAEMAGVPAQVVFTAASVDDADGEWEAISTILMEVAARLPDDSGLDAAVWYMGSMWLPPDSGEKTMLPCYIREFDGGATVVWSGGDGDQIESFFGTVTHFEGASQEVEQCKALQAQVAAARGSVDAAAPSEPPAGSVDYTVTPDEAVAIIEAGEHTVIDVRTPAEYEAAHVVGALNIDVEAPDFAERVAELDPEEAYLLYCRSGRRSDLAAQQMAAVGFSDIADAGGLVDLARAGAPIE